MSTDSFGQSKPTFTEDPLEGVYRDATGSAQGQTGHLKGEIAPTKKAVLAGAGIAGTVDLPEYAESVVSVKAYTTATGAAAAKELLEVTTDYTVSTVATANPQEVALGDKTLLATPAGGTDSFGQSKPTFVDTATDGTKLDTNYKHQNFHKFTRLTMVTDQSANTLVITYQAYTQLTHNDLP